MEKQAEYIPAVGRRKSASARIRLTPNGSGSIMVNEQELSSYFPTQTLQDTVMAPLKEVGRDESVDITVKVVGGGKQGQSVAVQLGIARALNKLDEATRKPLKARGFMTRDARVKERKKPGRHKARKAHQWGKR